MKDEHDEGWLDDTLRRGEPYIEDEGFTDRVMGRLPAPKRRTSKRPFILLGATASAALFALWAQPIRGAITGAALDLGRLSPSSHMPIGSIVLAVLVIWAAFGLTQSEA